MPFGVPSPSVQPKRRKPRRGGRPVPTNGSDQAARDREWLRQADAPGRSDSSHPSRSVFAASPRQAASSSSGTSRAGRRRHGAPDADSLDPVVAIRLGDTLERLDSRTVRAAGPVLAPLARTVDPDEDLVALVQGWTKNLLCVVARTDRRIIVVVDRFPTPLIESLDPLSTGVFLYGPPGTDKVSVSVVDGNRLLEISGVRDAEEAAALRGGNDREHRVDATQAPEYF
jgi:hypothetical protein